MKYLLSFFIFTLWVSDGGFRPPNRIPVEAEKKPPSARSGKDRALFVLVNTYKDSLHYQNFRNDAGNPIKDGRAIAMLLKERYGFEIEVLENPSLSQIGDTINEYAARYQKNEWDSTGQLLIYFSGHGESVRQNGYFITPQTRHEDLKTTALSYALWRPDLATIPCKHIMVAIDACFSGTFDPKWFNRDKNNDLRRRPGEMTDGQKLVANHALFTTRMFFTSATEVRSPEISNFARKFQEGLIAGGGKDGILTSTELFTYIEQANPRPHRGEFEGDDPGSSFLFFNTDYKPEKPGIQTIFDDIDAWKKAKLENTAAAYEAYLKDFPEGEFVEVAQIRLPKLVVQTLPDDSTHQFVRWADLVDPKQIAEIKRHLCELGLLDPNCIGDVNTPFHPDCSTDPVLGKDTRTAIKNYCLLAGIEFNDSLIMANLPDRLNSTDPVTFLPVEFADAAGDDSDIRLAKRVLRYMRDQGYWIARGPNMYNIVYVEGMDVDGKTNDNAFDRWNDRRLVIQIKQGGKPLLVLNNLCATEPGLYYTMNPLNPAGAAHLAFGQYKAWVVGLHKGSTPALVQRAELRFVRDSNKNGLRDTDDLVDIASSNGLNQYSLAERVTPEMVGKYNAGCLVGNNYENHLAFIDRIKTDSRYEANAGYLFMSTLIDGKAL